MLLPAYAKKFRSIIFTGCAVGTGFGVCGGHLDRFPVEFAFPLTREEILSISQIVMSKPGRGEHPPADLKPAAKTGTLAKLIEDATKLSPTTRRDASWKTIF